MTASELYEIVRDVPREAWPKGAYLGMAFGKPDFIAWDNGQNPSDELAESAFIGSMTAWLAMRGFFPMCNVWDDNKRPRASVFVNNRQLSHGGSSLVAALAAACKEVGNG